MERTPVKLGRWRFFLEDVALIQYDTPVKYSGQHPKAQIFLRGFNAWSFEVDDWDAKKLEAALIEHFGAGVGDI